jgi:hypothetical protein
MPRLRFALALVFATLTACASDVHPADAGRRDVLDVVDVSCPPDRPIRCNGECLGDTDSNPQHCGAACTMCNVPDHGSATCTSGMCGVHCSPGYVAMDGRCVDLPPPRPTRPLTNARVSVTQPTLHWSNPPTTHTAHVSVCRDRACTSVVADFDADGTSARVPNPLGAGVWFWNLRAIDAGVVSAARSATWSFHTPATSGPVEWSRESRPDVNGDGIDDFTIFHCTFPTPSSVAEQTEFFAGGSAALAGTPLPSFRFAPIGDVNGDGFTDLLRDAGASPMKTILGGAPDIAMLPTIQAATWPDAAVGVDFYEWNRPVGDFNGDGRADLFIPVPPPRVTYGSESGWTMPLHELPGVEHPSLAAVFDVDADGFDDVITAGPTWFRGGPTGLSSPQAVGSAPAFAVLPLDDFDGDGYLDAVQFDDRDSISLIRGSATGPVAGERHPLSDDSFQRLIVGNAGDFDGDGRAVLLFLAWSAPHRVLAYRGSTNGFTAADTFEPSLPCRSDPYRGARPIGDWDVDGHTDYVLWCGTFEQTPPVPAYLRLGVGTTNERWVPISTTPDLCAIE